MEADGEICPQFPALAQRYHSEPEHGYPPHSAIGYMWFPRWRLWEIKDGNT